MKSKSHSSNQKKDFPRTFAVIDAGRRDRQMFLVSACLLTLHTSVTMRDFRSTTEAPSKPNQAQAVVSSKSGGSRA
jgi:hypothetical protein